MASALGRPAWSRGSARPPRARGGAGGVPRRPAALVFPSGYQTNLGVLTALAGRDDLIVSDALNHASLVDGCRLSRARVAVYPHADARAARRLLAAGTQFRRRILVTESLFSMDGDSAPLGALTDVAAATDSILVVDEAHAFGVLGPGGRGLCAAARVVPDVLIGTLGKAAGTAGGFVAGAQALRDLLVNRARTFIFTTALPPPVAAAATAAVGLIRGAEGDQRRARLAKRQRSLGEALVGRGSGRGIPDGPILPVRLGSEARALAVAEALRARGFFIPAIRPPTVPAGSSRLRITLSAAHEPARSTGWRPPRRAARMTSARRRRGLFVTGRTRASARRWSPPACSALRAAGAWCRSRSSRSRPAAIPSPPTPAASGAAPAAHPADDVCLHACRYRRRRRWRRRRPAPDRPLRRRRPRHALGQRGDFLLVEGAGGLLVPTPTAQTTADLAARIGLPLLVVGRMALGTINHVALTLAEARAGGLPSPAASSAAPTEIGPHESGNVELIAALTGRRPLGVVPHLTAAARDDDRCADAVATRSATTGVCGCARVRARRYLTVATALRAGLGRGAALASSGRSPRDGTRPRPRTPW
jgi:8-amino-7-oxononanoate synthase